jgi:hypothetical protein
MGIPESREARYSPRGKTQTSYWKAKTIAERSLVVKRVAPRPAKSQEQLDQMNEERIGSFYKPQVPMIFAKLNMRPFQSKEQFQKELERNECHSGSIEGSTRTSTSSVTSPRASGMRAMSPGVKALSDLFNE